MENIKVQITLPIETLDLLKKDAISFGFIWKNKKQVNMNKLMNTIFANYLETYNKNQEDINKEIRKLFDNTLHSINKDQKKSFEIPDNYKDELINNLRLYIATKHLSGKIKTKETVRKEFGINKENVERYRSCRDLIGPNSSYSEFFRKLFISYSSLSFNQRELIIFKPVVDDLLKAIHSRKQIRITTHQNSYTVFPLDLTTTSIDPFNYLMCLSLPIRQYRNNKHYYRLLNIKYIEILDECNPLSQKQITGIKKSMKKHFSTESQFQKTFIKIHFSPIGMAILEDLNTLPEIVFKDVEKSIYTFLCTPEGCFRFLEKFKKEATVIEPISLAISFHERVGIEKLVKVNHQLRIQNIKPPVTIRANNIQFAKFALSKKLIK